MNNDFALAMRRALDRTRAQDVCQATSIIQAALAGKTGPDIDHGAASTDAPPPPQQRSRFPVIDLEAESVEPGTGPAREPVRQDDKGTRGGSEAVPKTSRLRKPLGEVVRALRDGRSALGLTGRLSGAGAAGLKTPARPQIPEGAQFLSRSFTCAAGARGYKLYIPAEAADAPRGLVVMLHGCTQSPDDFAAGTKMNAVAGARGLLVAYPAQGASDNTSSCWNWFRPGDQRRDLGEPAIIAGMTRALVSEFGLEQDRVFVAGLSAGGAMAAVMGETYPDLYAAVGIHSGLAYAAANDVMSAFAAMRGDGGPQLATAQLSVKPSGAARTIVFHGSADRTVHPSNAERIVASARAAQPSGIARSERRTTDKGRDYSRLVVDGPDGTPCVEYWLIDGAGHAWSGGHSNGTYTDPNGPDASAEMVRFFLNGA